MSSFRPDVALRVLGWACPTLLAAVMGVCAADADPGVAEPLFERTVAEVGRSRMVAFRWSAPAAQDQVLTAELSDPSVLEILAAPTVLAGETLGSLRVRGRRAGPTRVTLGSASFVIDVVAPRAVGGERGRPRIVAPAGGAVVWGDLHVGVECDDREGGHLAGVELRLPSGARLRPIRSTTAALGPTRHFVFQVSAADLGLGACDLTPVAIRTDGGVREGEPVRIHALAPAAGSVTRLEAEDHRDTPRSERWGVEKPPIGVDPAASGQQYTGNWGSDPALLCAFTAPETGHYQVVLTARGTLAGGAFPTVGLILDDGDQPLTNAVLIDEQWQRIPLGIPVEIERGPHRLVPYFLNDFWAENLADRNLVIDRLEVLRVPEAPGVPSTEGSPAPAMMQGAGAGESMMATMTAGATGSGSLAVALDPPLDGRLLQGELEVLGRCRWPGGDEAAPPQVQLLVNGRAAGRQCARAPKFRVDSGWFQPGANTLQLCAVLADGTTARSAVHTLQWQGVAGTTTAARGFHRFTARDEAWDPAIREQLQGEHDPPEGRAAAFYSNGEAVLRLPDALSGEVQILIEGRGDDFEGPPVVNVVLVRGGETVPVGECGVPGWWDTVPVGKVTLATGPKQLVFAFRNDKFTEGVGDRNLWLQAAVVQEVAAAPDTAAPSGQILWPAAAHSVWEQDAVIVAAADDRELAWIELVVDGTPTALRVPTTRQAGPVVLPLVARGLAPGSHTVAVRMADATGHESFTAPVTIAIVAAAPAEPGRYARALRLLDRFGFGFDPQELAAVLLLGEDAWLADRLARSAGDAGDRDAFESGVAMFPNRDSEYDVVGRAVQHALRSANPVRTRLSNWVENHFSTWIRKAGAELEWAEHREFTQLGGAAFPDLLFASAHSPAMLRYLDQQESWADRLNENYAREIMELHTLGVKGGYAQADVTALARVLTGWTFVEEGDGRSGGGLRRPAHRFDPALSDGRAERFFGLVLDKAAPDRRYDRARQAIEWLAAHPATAHFVCDQLAQHYVATPAPPALVADLTRVFLETYGDLRAVLTTLARHPAFWAATNPRTVCAPYDFAVRLGRACGQPNPWGVIEVLQRSGAGLMDRPTPDGYPEDDAAWTDTNALLQRWRFVRDYAWALANVVPPDWRWSDQPWTAAQRQALVDVVAMRLLGRVLSEASNRAVLDVLTKAIGSRDEICQTCASLVAQLPEANLR